MSSRKPKKPRKGSNRSRQSSTTLNASNASSVAASSVTSSTTSPSTSKIKTKTEGRAPDYFGFESSVCSVSDDSGAHAPKRHKTTNPVIEIIIQEEASQPPASETYFELTVVSTPAPPPVGTWSPESYEYDDYAREVSMSVFDAENQI